MDKWGVDQADSYLLGINLQIRDDAKVRRLAKPLPFVREGVMRLRYVRHYIYFYDRDGSLYVERVLHDSMDETLHLP